MESIRLRLERLRDQELPDASRRDLMQTAEQVRRSGGVPADKQLLDLLARTSLASFALARLPVATQDRSKRLSRGLPEDYAAVLGRFAEPALDWRKLRSGDSWSLRRVRRQCRRWLLEMSPAFRLRKNLGRKTRRALKARPTTFAPRKPEWELNDRLRRFNEWGLVEWGEPLPPSRPEQERAPSLRTAWKRTRSGYSPVSEEDLAQWLERALGRIGSCRQSSELADIAATKIERIPDESDLTEEESPVGPQEASPEDIALARLVLDEVRIREAVDALDRTSFRILQGRIAELSGQDLEDHVGRSRASISQATRERLVPLLRLRLGAQDLEDDVRKAVFDEALLLAIQARNGREMGEE